MAYGDNPGSRPNKKLKKKKPTRAPSTTDRTSPNPSPPPRPKAGPPSPQRTGRPTRPQPVARKRDAPPSRTERLADAHRAPEQKKHDRAVSDEAVRESRKRVIRKRSKALTERLTISSKGTLILKGGGPKRGRAAIPGATANPLDELGSPLGPEVNRLISRRSRPEDLKAPALKALEYLNRPLHAVASAAKEDVKNYEKYGVKGLVGHGSLDEAKKGLTGKSNVTFSDVLKEAGVKDDLTAGVAGFVLDMVLDPLQGAKISRLGPKQALERAARELEARAAKAASPRKIKGRTVRPARPRAAARLEREASKLREKARTAPESRGVQVGYDAKIPFGPRVTVMSSGKTSAKVGKKLAPAADRVRGSRVVQGAHGALSPTARRAGETNKEREDFTYAERKKRAGTAEALRLAQRRATAHSRATRRVDEPQMISAVEGAMKAPPTRTKLVKRKSALTRAVTAAERRLRTAQAKMNKERGRAAVLREQARKEGRVYSPPARLVKAEQAVADAREAVRVARESAKGAPRYEKYRVDAATGERYSDVRARSEKHTVDELPARGQRVARATERELEDLKGRQQDAGVLDGEREAYYPHQVEPDGGRKILRKHRAAKAAHANRRRDARPISEQHAEREARGEGPLFSTDHGATMGRYVDRAESAIADADYLRALKRAGKPLTAARYAKMRPTDELYRITDTGIQAVRHPNGKSLTDREVKALIVQGEDVTILPASRGDAEIRGRVGGKSEQTRHALRILNKPMATFKTAATVLNIPYYQIRNFMDDSFRAWAGDTPLSAFTTAVRLVKDQALLERRQASKLSPNTVTGTVRVAGKDMPRAEFLEQAIEDGALRTGFFAGDDLLEGSTKAATGLRRIRPVQKIREWSRNPEDVPRLAAYLGALNRGYTRQEAAGHLRLYMFDYDELTDIERVIRATLVPFYTYTKKNTVLHAKLFFSRPGKLAAVGKLREELNKYGADDERYQERVDQMRPLLDEAVRAGLISKEEVQNLYDGNFESLLTDADQRGFPIIGRDGSIMYMPLGITDLNRIPFVTSWEALRDLPGRQFDLAMQMVGPQKLPAELMLNYSFFFRDAIYRSADEPQAERWVTAPPWAEKAGLPTVQREVNGKKVDAWPAWLDYTLRGLGPQTGMLATVGNPATNSRGATWSDVLTKQVTGVRRARFDDRILGGLVARTADRLGEIDAEIADLAEEPGDRGRTADGFYFSKEYEGLLDEQKALTALIKRLGEARSGAKRTELKRLQRRPLTPGQEIRQKSQDALEDLRNAPERLREEQERLRAKQRIQAGGG